MCVVLPDISRPVEETHRTRLDTQRRHDLNVSTCTLLFFIFTLFFSVGAALGERALLSPLGNPASTPAYVSVVYFDSSGCVAVCRYALSNPQEYMCSSARTSIRVHKGSPYSRRPRPAAVSLHRRRSGRCRGFLPRKNRPDHRLASGSSVPHATRHKEPRRPTRMQTHTRACYEADVFSLHTPGDTVTPACI